LWAAHICLGVPILAGPHEGPQKANKQNKENHEHKKKLYHTSPARRGEWGGLEMFFVINSESAGLYGALSVSDVVSTSVVVVALVVLVEFVVVAVALQLLPVPLTTPTKAMTIITITIINTLTGNCAL